MELETENGGVFLQDVTVTNRVQIESEDGNVVLKNLSTLNIAIETERGDVQGVLSGKRADYNVTARTSRGKNNLQAGGDGNQRLSIRVESGDIQVTFAQD